MADLWPYLGRCAQQHYSGPTSEYRALDSLHQPQYSCVIKATIYFLSSKMNIFSSEGEKKHITILTVGTRIPLREEN